MSTNFNSTVQGLTTFSLYTVQQLLQAPPAPATAAQLLGLLARDGLSALPGAGLPLREATLLLLHQTGVPALPAVAITVSGVGALPRHPLKHAVSAASCVTARAPPRRQH